MTGVAFFGKLLLSATTARENDMRIHTICKVHNTTALVGPGTLLGELECVTCVRISDEKYAASRRPCCSRANIDCCGHDDPDDDYGFVVRIESPNFCNTKHEYDEVPF